LQVVNSVDCYLIVYTSAFQRSQNLEFLGVQHIRLQRKQSLCKAEYRCMKLCTSRNGNCKDTIEYEDLSLYFCCCIDYIAAKDLRLLASQIYTPGVTQTLTCYMQQCCYNEPLLPCRFLELFVLLTHHILLPTV
jgi:hypothetical protein